MSESKGALVISGLGLSLAQVVKVGQIMKASGMFPDLTSEAQAIVKVQAGQELGIPPFASQSAFQIITGKIALAPQGMLALINRLEGASYEIKKDTKDECHIEFTRPGRKPYMAKYTRKEAEEAGLLKGDNWKKYGPDMLFWRAVSRGFRRYFPDLAHGMKVYVPDEFGLAVNDDGEVLEVEFEVKPSTITTKEVEELESLVKEVGADRATWLKYLQVDSFDGITWQQYETVKGFLLKKKGA